MVCFCPGFSYIVQRVCLESFQRKAGCRNTKEQNPLVSFGNLKICLVAGSTFVVKGR